MRTACALDGDAALALDVHPVEVLRAHVDAFVDDAGDLQHAVGERRLAVVDVRDDAEVADGLPACQPGWHQDFGRPPVG
jgi:hypothetical protein